METVLIGGGSGLVGKRLSKLLTDKGYKVNILTRSPEKYVKSDNPYDYSKWDLKKGFIDEKAVEEADYIINLAGAGIADALWTKSRKKEIIESRVQTAELLKSAIEKAKSKPKAYISASAIGYYGNRGDGIVTEDSAPGDDGFLSKTTKIWEAAIDEVAKTGIRTVAIRIGVVMSTKGGALEKILLPFKVRVGSYFGDGEQWYSWIHLDDICRMFIFAIENKQMEGVYNGVAPHPEKNRALTRLASKATGNSNLVLPTPAFVLKMGMGEMSDVVLNSTRVSSQKIEKAGFKYKHPQLLPALKDLLARKI